MSDSTRTTGRMEFVPPLTWAQYRRGHEGGFADDGRPRAGASMLMLAETVEPVDTDEGVLTRRTALGLVPRFPAPDYDAHGKARFLVDELDLFARLAWDAGAELRGNLFTISDSDGLGVERWSIEHDRGRVGYPYRVVREIACLVWPDGSDAYVQHVQGYYELGNGPAHFTLPGETR